MKTYLKVLLVLILLPVFLYSGLQVYQICSAYARADAQYAKLAQYVTPPPRVVSPEKRQEVAPMPSIVQPPVPSVVQPSAPAEQAPPAAPEPVEEILWPQVDFEALAAINPDIVGWLTIEGTNVHYPVVQGADNDFYLSHQFDKSASRAGCLFLDMVNDAAFADENSIIYGHYTKDHTMFYELRGYKQQEFFDAHPTGWLMTPSAVYKLHFFSGYVSDVYSEAWETEFSENPYSDWLGDCKKKSLFASDTVPTENDRVLTLSTCSYEFENARFVLHAVMEEQSASPAAAQE